MKRILLLRTGVEVAPTVHRVGQYDDWFRAAFADAGSVTLRVVDAVRDELPTDGAWDGIVITGSRASVTERAPWQARLGAYLRERVARDEPILGVCYGHQQLVDAFGGRVESTGWELGTITVQLTPAGRADPLFASLPPRFAVQSIHRDSATQLPEGAVLLAGNQAVAVQAVALGPRVRAVQFHPELTPDLVRVYLHEFGEALGPEARDRIERGLTDSPWGKVLLANWVTHYL